MCFKYILHIYKLKCRVLDTKNNYQLCGLLDMFKYFFPGDKRMVVESLAVILNSLGYDYYRIYSISHKYLDKCSYMELNVGVA